MSCQYSNSFVRYKLLFTYAQNVYFRTISVIVWPFSLAIIAQNCISVDLPVYPEHDSLSSSSVN